MEYPGGDMAHQLRWSTLATVCLGLVLALVQPGMAQKSLSVAELLRNGDFEGGFYPFGSGYVGDYWVPYDQKLGPSPPQFLRSTLHKHDGLASQQIWSDNVPWYAGILQTTLLNSASGVRILAGRRYTVHVWVYSIYAGASSAVQDDKILKRVGIHPGGGVDPKSTDIVWTPWHGQDKTWVQINAAVEAQGDRLTVFVEAKDEKSGGQDQLYVDDVWLEEEGAPTPTRTRTPTRTPTKTPLHTATPTPTATPAIAAAWTLPVGDRPQGIAVVPEANRFFVANSGSDTVSSLEGFLGWRHIQLPSDGEQPGNLAVDPGRCRIYVTNRASNNVTVINTCGNQRVASVPLGTNQEPEGIGVVGATNAVYVANSGADTVAIIDGATLTVGPRLPTGPRPGQIAVDPATQRVFVTVRGNVPATVGALLVIDDHTRSVVQTISLESIDAAAEPAGLSVNPLTHEVFVSLRGGRLVAVDGQSLEIARVVAPPEAVGLDAVAVNPASNHVFVSSSTGNRVFVFDADEARWVTTVAVGEGWPRGIAANTLTGQVMVSNPSDDTVTVIQDHGLYQPFRRFLPITIITF